MDIFETIDYGSLSLKNTSATQVNFGLDAFKVSFLKPVCLVLDSDHASLFLNFGSQEVLDKFKSAIAGLETQMKNNFMTTAPEEDYCEKYKKLALEFELYKRSVEYQK